jgi:hypothetical protein
VPFGKRAAIPGNLRGKCLDFSEAYPAASTEELDGEFRRMFQFTLHLKH